MPGEPSRRSSQGGRDSGIARDPDEFELRAQRRRAERRTRRGGGEDRPPGGSAGPRRVAVLAVALAILTLLWALSQPFAASGGETVTIQVPKNATLSQIATLLSEEGIIESETMFKARVRLAGKSGDLKAGRFQLREDSSYGDVIDALSQNPVNRVIRLTIPEGLDRSRIAPLVQNAGIPGDYVKESADTSLINLRRYGAQSAKNLEGFLFPATFELKPGATVRLLVRRQLDAFQENYSTVNMARARRKNLTPYDVLIIASMVEAETSLAKERPLVAAVIYNRLKQGIPLGIDATTRFDNRNWSKPLTKSELAEDSPYNTRRNAGLPPGPIGNPGLSSIQAAARPASVDYLFYVVKPGRCGEHAFSSTDAQFQQDVARYTAAREAAGGKDPQDCP